MNKQKAGKEFAAKGVRYEASERSATLSMDIAGAYPPQAGVQSWKRTLALTRGKEVVVSDSYELKSDQNGISLSLMTCREPNSETPGTVVLAGPSGTSTGGTAEVVFDPKLFSVLVEPIAVEDPQLQSSWGEKIWRIVLTMKQTPLKGEFVIRVK